MVVSESRIMLVECGPHETRVAIVEDHRLAEIHLEPRAVESTLGSIYKGRVSRVLGGIEAAFVNIGLDRDAYLYTGDLEGGDRPVADLSLPLRAGQEILVQVVKEAWHGKGARISVRMSLPGSRLVLLPGSDQLAISRRIHDDEERRRLAARLEEIVAPPLGVIARTAATGTSPDSLRREYLWLAGQWEKIGEAADRIGAPARLHREPDLAMRMVRDLLADEFETVWVEGEAEYERLVAFVRDLEPEWAERIRLHDGEDLLFDRFDVEPQIDRALRSRVWLKSGGTIVIHPTEALVAIDVNTGRNVGRGGLEETARRTNLEAVKEIVRQIRLRDLSGILVLDFIDMGEAAHREELMAALEEEMRRDRARSRILPISEFGLVEITRKRTRANLQSLLTESCACCRGSGRVLSTAAICRRLYRDLLRRHRWGESGPLEVTLHPEVLTALAEEESTWREEMLELWGDGLTWAVDAALRRSEYRIGGPGRRSVPNPRPAGQMWPPPGSERE